MSIEWGTIKIPKELCGRLERTAAQFDRFHIRGWLKLPPEYVDRCPIHHVISMALDRLEKRRDNARAYLRSKYNGPNREALLRQRRAYRARRKREKELATGTCPDEGAYTS